MTPPSLAKMGQAIAREERYDLFCELATEHGRHDAISILRAFYADEDLIYEADQRWRREHITNVVGRVEGTVVRDGESWLATAECGPHRGQVRRFPTEVEATWWVRHCVDVPAEHVEKVRAQAGPGGANPSWAHLDENESEA